MSIPLKTRIESWLAISNTENLGNFLDEGQGLVEEARRRLEEHPESGRDLGPTLGQLRRRLGSIAKMEPLTWVPCLEGSLAIGHRPGIAQVESLALQGATHVLTLLTRTEGAAEVECLAMRHNLIWLHFPMPTARPLGLDSLPRLGRIMETCRATLETGGRLFIHCSAGIHRTGYFTLLLFRYTGLDPAQARNRLEQARPITLEQVGQNRLQAADQLAEELTRNRE